MSSESKKKMGCLKIGGIGFAILIGLSILGSFLPSPKRQDGKTAPTATATTVAPLEVTPRELEIAYEKNEASAQEKYGDNILLVHARINSIQLGIGDEPFLILGGDGILVCQSVSEILGNPMLKDCDIQ